VLLVAVDDTDSRAGGCTTALAALLQREFADLTPDGAPRLVRLNPNVPWKTRGNGAIALAFRGTLDPHDALDRARRVVDAHAQRAPGTEPGVVVADRPLPAWLYHATVTRIVERDELPLENAAWWGGRGVIGAAAALAWPAPKAPGRFPEGTGNLRGTFGERATWERIAYRDRMTRDVAPARVRDVELAFPTTFDSFDLVEDDVVCVPSSPCPVLWGLRGTEPDDLARASATLGPQRPASETLFLTNHASDDHLVDGEPRAFASVRWRGRVRAKPEHRNGHVFLDVGGARCAAYAPTRSFRRLVARLREGDDLTVAGGCHEGPDGKVTLGIEKLLVHEAAPGRLGNPLCPRCGRTMKSAGRNDGYRCCGLRAAAPRTTSRDELRGWHEVPASARRHLARPLKLGVVA
jgi:tRNA(Ile2)-agmatinylcytidine synthase